MKMEGYSSKELGEMREMAVKFKRSNFFRLPALFFGNKVAHRNPESKIRNFSTITMCFPLSTGKWIYLIYAYPLSIINRITDAIAKWGTEKYSFKTFSLKKWKESFIRDSFIPVVPIDVKNLVVLPYIENENFLDILAGRIGRYSLEEKVQMINEAARVINEMHARDVTWGELVVANMIRSLDGKIIICDTETEYYRDMPLAQQKASDWHDFLFSACGVLSRVHPEKIPYLVKLIFGQIAEKTVREELKESCRKRKSLLHTFFFLYDIGRLSCNPCLYNRVRKIISSF